MKANELMIGDWIRYGSRFGIVKAIKTDKCLILVSCNGNDELIWETFDNIESAPLTPEILEKNGWTYNDENAKFHPNTWSGNGLMLKQESECFRIVVVSDYDDEDTNDTPFVLQYINDLQHALKLRGKDKEIEL